jgi:hypothetical protein
VVSAFIYNICTLYNAFLTVTLETGLFISPILWRRQLKGKGAKSSPRVALALGLLGRKPVAGERAELCADSVGLGADRGPECTAPWNSRFSCNLEVRGLPLSLFRRCKTAGNQGAEGEVKVVQRERLGFLRNEDMNLIYSRWLRAGPWDRGSHSAPSCVTWNKSLHLSDTINSSWVIIPTTTTNLWHLKNILKSWAGGNMPGTPAPQEVEVEGSRVNVLQAKVQDTI